MAIPSVPFFFKDVIVNCRDAKLLIDFSCQIFVVSLFFVIIVIQTFQESSHSSPGLKRYFKGGARFCARRPQW